MPTVLNYPAIQRYPDTRGQEWGTAIGGATSKLSDLLLQAILSGQFNRIPLPQTPQTPATLRLPSGLRPQISPAEQVARGPMAGQTFEQMSRAGVLPPGVKFQPTTVNPQQLQQMVNVAALQEKQADVELKQRQAKYPPFDVSKFLPGGGTGRPSGNGTEGFGLTGIDIDPVTGEFKLKLGETPESKAAREAQTQTEKDLAKRRQETQEGFRRTMGLFTQIMGQFKSKIAAQGGEGGVLPGALGFVRGKARAKGAAAIEAFEGQRNETALGLNSIVTGQNRVIKGVVEMLYETLPDRFDSLEFAEQKIAQSIANAFRLTVANNRGILTKDVLEGFDNPTAGKTLVEEFVDRIQLTAQEEGVLQKLTDQILSTPASVVKSQQGIPATIQRGPSRPDGIEMIDAQGNRAYIYPDGTVEDIP